MMIMSVGLNSIFQVLSSWSDWTECSVTCGPGTRVRTRTCDQGCGDVTNEDLMENKYCYEAYCPGSKFLVIIILSSQSDALSSGLAEFLSFSTYFIGPCYKDYSYRVLKGDSSCITKNGVCFGRYPILLTMLLWQ